MRIKNCFVGIALAAMMQVCVLTAFAGQDKVVKLPEPQTEGGKPFMQVLKERKTTREFSLQELSLQMLSDLLWAACGVNRAESGYRTAPSSMNMQEIDVYVALSNGLYIFDAQEHALILVTSEDIRGSTGKQPFVHDAPVNLIYVADFSRMKSNLSAMDMEFYAATDTGFISENVYLYCASFGLATVVRGWVDKPLLAKQMKLRPEQKIILAQTVGFFKQVDDK